MRCFPQLATGAMVQIPMARTEEWRTIASELPGGARVASRAEGGQRMLWRLPLTGLSRDEAGALESLFEACSGRLESFCFVDPLANLLAWSDDLSQPCWAAETYLERSAGVPDPEGRLHATGLRNTGPAPQGLSQQVGVPGVYTYCFSVQARSAAGADVTLRMEAGSTSAELPVRANSEWRRFALTSTPGVSEAGVTFGLTLEPGQAVEVYGLQVDAQPCPSEYRRSGARSGFYPETRFDQDTLEITADGPNQYRCTIRLKSQMS